MIEKNRHIPRQATPALAELANSFPIVSITGPRQSGKTTLARQHFPEKTYLNLEDPEQRAQVIADPKGIIAATGVSGAIFDEVQHFPALLSYLQVASDAQPIPGRFIVTGSYNLALMESLSQSLAGRVGLLELLPLSTSELNAAQITLSTDEYLQYGGLPRIFQSGISPTLTYRNYVKTYLERDMRQLLHVKDLSQFQRFMQLCASRIGSEFNASHISNEIGVSYHTIQAWLSVLEASYLILRLPPYFENFGKRIIKSPKLYFSDVGLATYLLGIETTAQLSRDPLKGNLFENLVVLECYKYLLNQGREPRLWFYRDSQQHEVDLIWQSGRELIPIEIKYGQTWQPHFIKNLSYFQQLCPERVPYGYVVYTGDNSLNPQGMWRALHYTQLDRVFKAAKVDAR